MGKSRHDRHALDHAGKCTSLQLLLLGVEFIKSRPCSAVAKHSTELGLLVEVPVKQHSDRCVASQSDMNDCH